MAIIEYLISSPADLGAPGGVTFPTKSTARERDLKAWNDLMPELFTYMKMGMYVMAVIQYRAIKGPNWDPLAKNFSGFNPAEDGILAAYCLDSSFGSPYQSGLCSTDWVKNLMSQAATGTKLDDIKTVARQTTRMFQVFQCSTQGFKLAHIGCMALLKHFSTNGPPNVNPMVGATKDMVRPEQWGWRGGAFPTLMNKPPRRA